MKQKEVILYISMSLDGYIATKDDDISFLELVAKEGEDYGYNAFVDTISSVIVGKNTYEKVVSMGVEFPYPMEKKVFILCSTEQEMKQNIRFWNKPIKTLVDELKNDENEGNIFVDGGSMVVRSFMEEELIDRIVVSIIPIILGDGKKLFQEGKPSKKLTLVQSKSYLSGLVQLEYEVNK
jgi:dihydrofolate reductase